MAINHGYKMLVNAVEHVLRSVLIKLINFLKNIEAHINGCHIPLACKVVHLCCQTFGPSKVCAHIMMKGP